MNRLENFYKTTLKLHDQLKRVRNNEKKADKLARINILIEKRAHLMSQVAPPFSKEEKKMINELIKFNEEIQNTLNELLTDESAEKGDVYAYQTHSPRPEKRQEMFIYR
ncbi:hypothetical protein [Radiobacillus sp. PE A8.2]|uniref:hypothetical protein n=1 Tax=Radiobacillus sp. PE A8.2 TaxID=3380349 RepID=UPI00388D77C7